jgi:hypothetical protein
MQALNKYLSQTTLKLSENIGCKINITNVYCILFSVSNTNIGCVFSKFLYHGVSDFSFANCEVQVTKAPLNTGSLVL